MGRRRKRVERPYGWKWDDSKHPDSDLFQPRRPRAKKDTKRWCRGKVGVEHQKTVVMGQNYSYPCKDGGWFDRETRTWHSSGRWICWHVIACENCGKQFVGKVECPDREENNEAKGHY